MLSSRQDVEPVPEYVGEGFTLQTVGCVRSSRLIVCFTELEALGQVLTNLSLITMQSRNKNIQQKLA